MNQVVLSCPVSFSNFLFLCSNCSNSPLVRYLILKSKACVNYFAIWGLQDCMKNCMKDFKMRGQQQQRERTIALIIEYNSCTLECSERATCSPSSSLIRRGKLTFGVLWTKWTSNNKIWQSLFAFEAEPFTFYCSKISCKVATKHLSLI